MGPRRRRRGSSCGSASCGERPPREQQQQQQQQRGRAAGRQQALGLHTCLPAATLLNTTTPRLTPPQARGRQAWRAAAACGGGGTAARRACVVPATVGTGAVSGALGCGTSSRRGALAFAPCRPAGAPSPPHASSAPAPLSTTLAASHNARHPLPLPPPLQPVVPLPGQAPAGPSSSADVAGVLRVFMRYGRLEDAAALAVSAGAAAAGGARALLV